MTFAGTIFHDDDLVEIRCLRKVDDRTEPGLREWTLAKDLPGRLDDLAAEFTWSFIAFPIFPVTRTVDVELDDVERETWSLRYDAGIEAARFFIEPFTTRLDFDGPTVTIDGATVRLRDELDLVLVDLLSKLERCGLLDTSLVSCGLFFLLLH